MYYHGIKLNRITEKTFYPQMQQIFEIQSVFLICVICVLLFMLSDLFPGTGSDILQRS
jgi:hypothetical protein